MGKLNSYTTDPLSAEEERDLARAWRDRKDTKARDRIIFSNLRFAMKLIAERDRVAESDDLEQECVVGMMQALERFDPERGFRFITYAADWIRVGIERAEIGGRNIKLPPRAFAAVGKGSSTTLSAEAVAAAKFAACEMTSLDEPAYANHPKHSDTTGVIGVSPRESIVADPGESYEAEERGRVADELMNLATPFERLILQRRYFDERGLREIGEELGMSREGVRLNEVKALDRLRTDGNRNGVPLFTDAWWADEWDALRDEFSGVVTMLRLRAWAAHRYAINSRLFLNNVLAWGALKGRCELGGHIVNIDGKKRKRPKAGARRSVSNG